MFRQIINKIAALKYYQTDQKGIINRYFNENENWNNHLQNSKDYILNCLPDQNLDNLAVLGSGWLLDVPIDELLKRTKKLTLIDIHHPKEIINKYKHNQQITFCTVDLTNGLVEAAKSSKTFTDFLKFQKTAKPLINFDNYSFVISLNLLNQLDILLCDLLMKRFNIKEDELLDIRKSIQTNHLKSLQKGKSCVITDYEEINYINSIADGVTKSLIFADLSNLKIEKDWLWTFDTHKTYKKKNYTTFKVFGGVIY